MGYCMPLVYRRFPEIQGKLLIIFPSQKASLFLNAQLFLDLDLFSFLIQSNNVSLES
jgi:hypothetical protein